MDIALSFKYQYYMKSGLRTFIKHTAKDFHNQSVNPPVVRASTIIFKNLQEIEKTEKKYLKDPRSGNFNYGRQGTPTTYALQKHNTACQELIPEKNALQMAPCCCLRNL